MARIVLDTDVISLYRTGRLPPGFARHVVASELTIAFAHHRDFAEHDGLVLLGA